MCLLKSWVICIQREKKLFLYRKGFLQSCVLLSAVFSHCFVIKVFKQFRVDESYTLHMKVLPTAWGFPASYRLQPLKATVLKSSAWMLENSPAKQERKSPKVDSYPCTCRRWFGCFPIFENRKVIIMQIHHRKKCYRKPQTAFQAALNQTAIKSHNCSKI